MDQHFRAVPRRERDLCRLASEQHAAELAGAVLEREVHVAGRSGPRLHNFALDPKVLELVPTLDVLGKPYRELTNANDALWRDELSRRARGTHPSACRP